MYIIVVFVQRNECGNSIKSIAIIISSLDVLKPRKKIKWFKRLNTLFKQNTFYKKVIKSNKVYKLVSVGNIRKSR